MDPTPQQVAHQAREALAKSKETPQEHWDRLIRMGFINKEGEVTKLLGGDADPEPFAENQPEPESRPTKRSRRNPKKG